MLDFLVTSKARRRMLLLLWSEGRSGSASDLAERAGVGFASAYRELQAMRRLDLAVAKRCSGVVLFSANERHSLRRQLRALICAKGPARYGRTEVAIRARLSALGAPVIVGNTPKVRGSIEKTLVAGVSLAHRDPAVARSLPVAFYRQSSRINIERLTALAREHSERAGVGFFLDLTAQLSGDRRLATWARTLRDRRVYTHQPFFYGRAAALEAKMRPDRSPSVARRWGFRLNLEFDDFRSLFEKVNRAA